MARVHRKICAGTGIRAAAEPFRSSPACSVGSLVADGRGSGCGLQCRRRQSAVDTGRDLWTGCGRCEGSIWCHAGQCMLPQDNVTQRSALDSERKPCAAQQRVCSGFISSCLPRFGTVGQPPCDALKLQHRTSELSVGSTSGCFMPWHGLSVCGQPLRACLPGAVSGCDCVLGQLPPGLACWRYWTEHRMANLAASTVTLTPAATTLVFL